MIGLKRGSVELTAHQEEWNKNAENVILELKQLLGDAAVDIQHVGSTAIASIYAKPIIDIVIGVRNLNDIVSYVELLKQHDFVFRGEDVEGQLLFVIGDFEKDTRTHHIHVVKWNGAEWNNYINFRDYLNCHPDKARSYDACKKKMASRFPDDRRSYTAGKQDLIECLLKEAHVWRTALSGRGMAKEIFDLYSSMQNLNRSAIKHAAATIEIGMRLSDIKELLENYLLENGADSFWYWDVGAFIFAGDETALSVSGKDYKIADRVIRRNEPHISIPNSRYGYKKEDIYYFANGKLVRL